MNIVLLTPAHLPAIRALLDALDYAPQLDQTWLRWRIFDDAACAPDLLLAAEEGGELIGFCVGGSREGKGMVKLLAVAPAHRRRDVGTALFEELERRMLARGLSEVVVGAVGTGYFEPGVDVRRTDIVSFLLHRGYETDRQSRVDMAVDLAAADLDTSAVEASLAQRGIALRRATHEDLPAIATFALQTFSEGWRQETLFTARWQKLPLFVAFDGAQVVGFAAYDVCGPARFGPTGTRPDYRRYGIGGALLKMCLRDLRERGDHICEISWAGPLGYYARAVDARIHKVYWLFKKKLG